MCHHYDIGIQMGPFLLHSIIISYHFWSFQFFFSTAIVHRPIDSAGPFYLSSLHILSINIAFRRVFDPSFPLPGFGIGPKLSAMVGGMMRASSQRFFAKTSNQALGRSLGIGQCENEMGQLGLRNELIVALT